MSTNLNPSAFRRLEAIGYIPGECNPIAWMLDRLERAAKVKPDDAAALIRRAHDMVRDLCKRRDEPGAREWQMSIPARPDHDPDLVIGAALDAADDLASEVGRLRDALATVTRERDEARAMVTEYRTRVDGIETERVWAVDAFNRTSRDLTDLRAMYQDAQTELGRTAEAIHGEPADAHCLHEWAAEVVRERDELRAALLNERGEGDPPSEGWTWRPRGDRVGEWEHESGAHVAFVHGQRHNGQFFAEWRLAHVPNEVERGGHVTAREAMRAADTALAGAKS